MSTDWSSVTDDIEADVVTADVCLVGAIGAFVSGLVFLALRPGGLLGLVPLVGFAATPFLFIYAVHCFRRSRQAAEEFCRSVDQLMWEEWVSGLPPRTRRRFASAWSRPASLPSSGTSAGPPTK